MHGLPREKTTAEFAKVGLGELLKREMAEIRTEIVTLFRALR